jgi:hypothetical protein
MQRVPVLRELLAESMYVVDEERIAEAILVRARARGTLPDLPLRADCDDRAARSFRLEQQARSFRLSSAARRELPH